MSKRKWTEEEDTKLIDLVSGLGQSVEAWKCIAEVHFPHRNPKQCRERYMFHLNPTVEKGPWSLAEERLLFQLQATIGNAWTDISGYLPGRSEASVKNRFYSALRRVERAHRVAQSVAGDMLAMHARASMTAAEAERVAGIARDLAEGGSMCKTPGAQLALGPLVLPTLPTQQAPATAAKTVAAPSHGSVGGEQARSRSGRAIKPSRLDADEYDYEGSDIPAVAFSAGTLGLEDSEADTLHALQTHGLYSDNHDAQSAYPQPHSTGGGHKRSQFEDAVIATPLQELNAALASFRSLKRSLPSEGDDGPEQPAAKSSSSKKARTSAPCAQRVYQTSEEQGSVSGGSSTGGGSGGKKRLQAMVATAAPISETAAQATADCKEPEASEGNSAPALVLPWTLQGHRKGAVPDVPPPPTLAPVGHVHGTRQSRARVELTWQGLLAPPTERLPTLRVDGMAEQEQATHVPPAAHTPRTTTASLSQVQARPPAPPVSVRLAKPSAAAVLAAPLTALPDTAPTGMLSPPAGKYIPQGHPRVEHTPVAPCAPATPSVLAGLPSAGLLPFSACLKADLRLDGMSEASYLWMSLPGQAQSTKSKLPPLLSNVSLGLHLCKQGQGPLRAQSPGSHASMGQRTAQLGGDLLPPLGRHALPSPDTRYDLLGGAGQGFTQHPPLPTSQASPGHSTMSHAARVQG